MSTATATATATAAPGRRLLAVALDALAASNPDQAWVSVPLDDSALDRGFRDVSFADLALAVDRAAHWLDNTLGKTALQSFPPFAYLGSNDLRLPILAVAAAKVGRSMLVPFPLAPPPVLLHLLNTTRCTSLLHPAPTLLQVQQLLSDQPHVQPVAIPALEEWLAEKRGNEQPYLYRTNWEETKDDPWIIFHTSGTTGLPKPITYSQRMMTAFDAAQAASDPRAQLAQHRGCRVHATVPLSHFSGLSAILQTPVFLNTVVVLGPADVPPSLELTMAMMRYGNLQGLAAPPFLLHGLAFHSDESRSLLASLDFVQWVGAPLDPQTGSKLVALGIKSLAHAIGTTECGPYFTYAADNPTDWASYCFQPGQGIVFTPRLDAGDDLFELVFQKEESAWQPVFHVFPELSIYPTRDLFRKHPSKADHWLYAGRTDEMVLLSNGGRVHAPTVEERITRHSSIQAALVGGSGQSKTFAIVEAAVSITKGEGEGSRQEHIWAAVEEANSALLSPITNIGKHMLIILSPEDAKMNRSLVRGGPKGGIARYQSLHRFKDEISALYSGSGATPSAL